MELKDRAAKLTAALSFFAQKTQMYMGGNINVAS